MLRFDLNGEARDDQRGESIEILVGFEIRDEEREETKVFFFFARERRK